MQIFDISIPLKTGMVVYPNNPEFKRVVHKGETSVHSELMFGSHTGTHVDAPAHMPDQTQTIDQLSLEHFYGKVRVIEIPEDKKAVTLDDIDIEAILPGERILFKTANSKRGFDVWYDEYVYVDGGLAEELAKVPVALVGIDALSIKQRGSSDLRPHAALLNAGIPILEGIDLSAVLSGTYTLSALPLNISDGDGAPCRAVLIQE